MKILVTGGAGYIGSHTIVELLGSQEGFEIISADNFSTSTPETFDRIEAITGKRVKNYDVDLSSFQETEHIFKKNPDIVGVIHFAAYKAVGESVENPLMYYSNNLNSLINVLKCCDTFNVTNFIFSSSCTVYGDTKTFPVLESTPLNQTSSPYGETKLVGERIISDFTKTKKEIKTVILRYFNPVGAHPSGLIGESSKNKPNNLVPIITQTAAGIIPEMYVFGTDYNTRDGSCVRDYVHVTDIAIAHVKSLNYILNQSFENNPEIFNLGTGNGVTVLEAINAFMTISKVKLNYKTGERRKGDLPACYADINKAHSLLHWKPKYTIEEMMVTAWKWQQNQLNQIVNHE